ncbi:hypothetical protein EDD85DRAFT_769552, partial [Armillaria nabsnona]
ISGSAVALEHIFSSGWDSVSMHCARLQPETIRMLMLVKHHLQKAHEAIDIVLDNDN